MKTPTEIREIRIKTIPHDEQRYDTVGDYVFAGPENKELWMTVSDMENWRFGLACAIHEAVEAALLVTRKIDEAQVTEFDKDYEDARQEILRGSSRWGRVEQGQPITQAEPGEMYRSKWACPCEIDNSTEPGEDIHSPYYREHMFADNLERLVLRELGGEWKEYQAKVESMVWRKGNDPFGENGEASEDVDDNA